MQADRLYLYEFFAPHGAVLSVRVLTDETGACRGVGFVNYSDSTSALAAVQVRSHARATNARAADGRRSCITES